MDRLQLRGLTGVLPIAWEPRLFAGYAFGSRDSEPEAGTDRSFRQTGLHANEAGFGGVERYAHYGVLARAESVPWAQEIEDELERKAKG